MTVRGASMTRRPIKPTPRQLAFLEALRDAPSGGMAAADVAERSGYSGKTHQAGGGAARAPMWAAAMAATFPRDFVSICGMPRRYFLGPAGRRFLLERAEPTTSSSTTTNEQSEG